MSFLLLLPALLAAPPARPVDFDTDVAPILSWAGCNAASCHGAAAGRGGFRLSLFGGDPAADYDALVRQLEGRRIDLVRPAESLLLTKPTGYVDHGGGVRLEEDGPQAATVLRWIREGARRERRVVLEALRVEPSQAVVASTPAAIRLAVTAAFREADGRRRQQDVTQLAVIRSEDDSAVQVGEAGQLRILRGGRHVVVIRYLDQIQAVQLTAPLGDTPLDLAGERRRNWIDDEVLAASRLRLRPGPPATPQRLLRRVTLDLTGRLPTPEQLATYLGQPPEKRYEQLVDRLLQSPEFVEFFSYRLAVLFRVRGFAREPQPAEAFHRWLAAQLEQSVGWDQMTRAVLSAVGDTHENGPANFYRLATGPREQAEYASELFLGVGLRCANCHNHPLDRWTQDDYHGLAAIFARFQRGRVVQRTAGGDVVHPATGAAATPRLPGQRFLTENEDSVGALADWLTARDNPYFASAAVNRLWKWTMGRGLVEPADDLRATNPGAHPRLLKRLSDDFAEHGYDLRRTLRIILTSETYRRAARAGAEPPIDPKFWAYATEVKLPPEVLLDAICDVTGVPESFPNQPPGRTRAIQLVDPGVPSPALDVLGRCDRQQGCQTTGGDEVGLASRLHLLNGPLLNDKIADPRGRLAGWLKAGVAGPELVRRFYQQALCREPTPAETRYWDDALRQAGETGQQAVLEDFLWSLLNTREFTSR